MSLLTVLTASRQKISSKSTPSAATKLRAPALRERMRNESDRYWRFIHKGEWERVYFQATPQHPELGGLNFRQISDQLGKDPWDCYLDILADAGADYEAILTVGTLFTDEHLAEMISHPLFCLGVDAFTDNYASTDKWDNLRGLLEQPGFQLLEADLAHVDLEAR